MARSNRNLNDVISDLRKAARPENRDGMARFGIDTQAALGISMPEIRRIGRTTTRNHALAKQLWDSGIHEARILASLVDEPEKVTRRQMEDWAADFNSWDLCDQVTGNLFDRLPFADQAIETWHRDERQFVKRAAFAMIAWRAVHLKNEPDATFLAYLPLIREAAADPRNFVKKAVNWALRQIGKRNSTLHKAALSLARELAASAEKPAQWIGRDALRELTSEKVLRRLESGPG